MLPNVKDAARVFFESYSVPVIPVDSEKHPLVEWKHLQTESMTQKQFEDLPWDKSANFAVVTGTKTKGNYYFVAIDVDKPIDYGLLQTTMMEETPRGGRHLYYLAKNNCGGLKLNDIGIELLGLGQIVIVRGKWLNDNLPTVVENAGWIFSDLARSLGKTELTRGRQPLSEVLKPQTEGGRNIAIFDLAAALRDKKVPFDTAFRTAIATSQTYDPPLPEPEVKATVQSAYEDPLLETRPDEDPGSQNYVYPEVGVNSLKEQIKPLSIDELTEILGSTVRHDDVNKAITFLTMLLTYTEEDQINLGFLAESSTGKSYIPLELSWYFPKEDVLKTGYASPTAFFHDWGALLTDPSDKRDVEEDKKRKVTHIDLHQKILIFLDQPHDQLLQRLRSLLSHDEKQIIVKIADRSQKSGLRTKNIALDGYPTVLFCTAKFTMQDQEKTRLLLLSPEIDQEKLRDTIALKLDKEGDREAFYKRMMEDPQRKLLAARVWAIKAAEIKYVKIPEDSREEIYRHFMQTHKFLIPRHQRDISRLVAIIKGHALLNCMHREKIEDSVFVNVEDVKVGFMLYSKVSEANELGLSPELYTVYLKLKPHIENRVDGIERKDFQKLYFREFHKVIGREHAANILKIWESVGLILEQPDPVDRRKLRYVYPDMGVSAEDATPELPPPWDTHSFVDPAKT